MKDHFGRIKEYPVLFPLSQYIFGVVIGLLIRKTYPCYWFLLLLSGLLFFFGCLFRRFGRISKVFSFSLFFIWLGIFLFGAKFDVLNRKIRLDTSYPRRIEGIVTDYPTLSQGRSNFRVKVTEILDSSDKNAVNSIVKVYLLSEDPPPRRGEKVSFLVWLSRLKKWNFRGPPGLGLRGLASPSFKGFLKDKIEIETVSGGDITDRILTNSLERIRGTLPLSANKDALGVLGGTMWGDKKGISREVMRWFKASGLVHILVVSGFNIGMVFTFFFLTFHFLFSRWGGALMKVDVNLISTLIAFWPSLYYAFLTGLPYPTLRSILMMVVFIGAFLLSRPVIGLNILFWVVFLIAVFDPLSLFDVSLQLSAGAVFGIIYGMGKVRPLYFGKFKREFEQRKFRSLFGLKLKLYFLDLLAVSTLAFLFTLPISVYYFSTFSSIGILANLFFVPVFSFLIFPIGLLGMTFAITSLPGVSLIWRLDLLLVSGTNYFISLFSKIPISLVSTGRIYFEDVAIYYFLLLLFLNWKTKFSRIGVIAVAIGFLICKHIFGSVE